MLTIVTCSSATRTTKLPLPKQLATAVKARKDDITIKTKITIWEANGRTEFSDGDVWLFPEMIKYRGLNESNIDSFVEDVIVNGKPWAAGKCKMC